MCEVGQEHKVVSVVHERAVPQLQQEDEDGRVIHNKKIKTENKTRERRRLICFSLVQYSVMLLSRKAQ